MPLNDAYAELKGKAAEGRARTGGADRKERRAIKLASCPCAAIFVHVSAKDGRKRFWVPYLWSRMPRHQTGELQGFSLSDGVDSLRVPLLLNIAGMPWVYNADSRRGCGGKQKKRESPNHVSILVISEGMSSLAQQMAYWLRGCLDENKHCGHVCAAHNTPKGFCSRSEEKKNRDFYSILSGLAFKHC